MDQSLFQMLEIEIEFISVITLKNLIFRGEDNNLANNK